MKKRLLALLLSVSMISALALSGCGSSEPESTEAGATEAATAEKTEAVEATGEEVHLRLVISIPRYEEQFTNYLDQFCEKYEAEKGIKVTYEMEMPEDNTSAVLQTRLTTGDPVDIFAIHALQDLPQYAAAGYTESVQGEEFVDKLFEGNVTATSYQGEAMGVPLETMTWGYLYNKDIFAEIGITEVSQMPTTLTEMEEVCTKLEEAGHTPFVLAYKDIPWTFWPMQLSKEATTRTQVPDWFERMNKSEASWTEVPNLFDALKLINEHGTDRALDMSTDDGCAAFALGEGAMMVTGPWYAESILSVEENFNLGVAALPVSENPDECMINSSASTMLCLNTESQNKEVAKDLLAYFVDDEDSSSFFESCMFNPVTQAQQDLMDVNPWVNEGQEWVNNGKYYMDDQNVPSTCCEDIQKLLQAWYAGEETDESFMEKADAMWHDSNVALGEQFDLE